MVETSPVLISLDGSSAAESAIPFAVELSRLYGAPLHFIHVIEGDAVTSQEVVDVTRWFSGHVETVAATFKPALPDVQAKVVTGNPAEALLDAAAGARFMVIASHGRSGLRATIVGSVADKVVRGATTPVLFVPVETASGPISGGTTVVALDGSPAAERGLTLARELAAKADSKLVLLQAYNPVPPVAAEYAVYPLDIAKGLEEAAHAYLRGVAQAGETAVAGPGPADIVVEAEADRRSATLIALTSQGKGLAKRIAFGSTTDRLMHSTKRPLLIVPAKPG
jgi:nucleotide-binding universal stress UspA family protein